MAVAMGRENGDWLYAAVPPAGSGGGLKWQTWQTFAIPKSRLSCLKSGGREGIRTPGLLIANEALSQLSYSPTSSKSILANAWALANTRSTARKQAARRSIGPDWVGMLRPYHRKRPLRVVSTVARSARLRAGPRSSWRSGTG